MEGGLDPAPRDGRDSSRGGTPGVAPVTLIRPRGDELLEAYRRAFEARDVDTAVELYAPDAEVRLDPFEEPLRGDLAIRAAWNELAATRANVELDIERFWVSGDVVLASWHGAYTRRDNADRVRLRGFLMLEVGADGRIVRHREWTHARVVGTDRTFRTDAAGGPR